MSEATLTKGWQSPKGLCDMCRKKKATQWFGDTSVALCNDEDCAERNLSNWQRGQADLREEE